MTGFDSKREAAADKLQEHDPCPMCIRGGVCRTPKCGRLALPLDHPFRNLQPAQSEKEKISQQMTAEIVAARALAQPAQEPVAEVIDGVLVKSALPEKYTGHLYTAPPQRPWVGLTDEERDDLLDTYITAEGRAQAIEAKLKEKNT